MVLVANSRSASTELPREQNHPGRRFEQAAQPAGTCREMTLCRVGDSIEASESIIVFAANAV
jgi:hypothetical protein